MPASDPQAHSQAAVLPDFVLRQFDRGHPDFDHRQLYDILQRGIRAAVLPAGAKLPASRVLAQALGIARNTVVHVYEQLVLEGFAQAQVGRGTFVADVGPRLAHGTTLATATHPASAARANLSARGMRLLQDAAAARGQAGATM